ncbi:type III-B CRISPR module-associated protein Cmr3 [Myxococcus sp. AS-1-15]|uniref:type III-B CRISPR module-associated protein Cmr3 n=1 Tax=Myxococcus sp. AS-1-15 TaxID=2874600 RepID=UPI001CBB4465|nr:type III-B CRISPR module-associated protein Cmr3 [Myxococcus sp. AS-1-15]MBZ4402158.1 type III-B CRISPR module-associated protein Cmr3 [Myxococcus sp. AS-1-15]
MSEECFALLPRDGLSVKDGRGWYTSEVGRGYSHPWPLPTTVRGALRAAWGQDLMSNRPGVRLTPEAWEQRSASLALKGFVALRRDLGETSFTPRHRMWPAPADAVVVAGKDGEPARVERLRPWWPDSEGVITSLGPDEDRAREALWHPRPDHEGRMGKPSGDAPAFWSEADMVAWLLRKDLAAPATPGPGHRTDLHVAIAPDKQTAEDTMLHSRQVVELLRLEKREGAAAPVAVEWALGVRCRQPEGEAVTGFPSGVLGLGGRRRLTEVERSTADLFACPEDFQPEPSMGLKLVLATPASFERGWLPDGFACAEGGEPEYVGTLPGVEGRVVLRAALVPRAQDVSAWDMVKRQPRATRRWVPAGAVYFFEKVGGGWFTTEELRALWLASWGGGRDEALGQVLPGVWELPPECGA